MRRLLLILFTIAGVALGWRWASRHRSLPCPTWAAWLLDNPFTETIAGTETTLDRIGLRPGQRGLDVGCGPGRLSIPAARRAGPEGAILAYDVQPGMLDLVRRRVAEARLTNVETRLGDIATDAGLGAASFDRAWLVTVLGEIPDRAAALRNLYRVLKPGGTLSITEIVGDPHYQRRSAVISLCQEAGFQPANYWGTALAFTQNVVKP